MRALLIAIALFAATFTGCQTSRVERQLDKLSYFADNDESFQPNRMWRLKVRWEPYLLDSAKAMLVKQFQFIVHGDADRRKLEAEIKAHGGDTRYLRWFESELFPIGLWERREHASVARYHDSTIVSLTTRAHKEVPRTGYMIPTPVSFPDPLLRAISEGCHALNWDVIPSGDSVGLEIMLESRDDEPAGEKWNRRQFDSSTLDWRMWSVSQQKSIAYRTYIHFKTNVARCPLPPKIHDQLKIVRKGQPMGVEW